METQSTPTTTPATPPLETRKTPSFMQKNRFTIISVIILILALVPLILLSRGAKKVVQTPTTTAMQPVTPTPALTQNNAQPTIDAADQNIQQTINQADSEINAVNQIDSSQDSTAGL